MTAADYHLCRDYVSINFGNVFSLSLLSTRKKKKLEIDIATYIEIKLDAIIDRNLFRV